MNSIAKISVGVGTIRVAVWIGFYAVNLESGSEWYEIPTILTCIALGVGGGITAERGLREENIID